MLNQNNIKNVNEIIKLMLPVFRYLNYLLPQVINLMKKDIKLKLEITIKVDDNENSASK